MNWRRLAWLVILLLITTIVWGAVDLKEMYEKIASASSEDTHDVSRRLVSLEKRRANHGQRIESLEKLALWPSGESLMSWLTQQAHDSDVTIIGVEHLPVEEVSEYQHIPVKITIRGDYNPLGRFINKLERSPNKVRIDSFRIKRKEYTPEHVIMDLSLSYFQEMEKLS
jgi:Tfp pilus assembly protein PilO